MTDLEDGTVWGMLLGSWRRRLRSFCILSMEQKSKRFSPFRTMQVESWRISRRPWLAIWLTKTRNFLSTKCKPLWKTCKRLPKGSSKKQKKKDTIPTPRRICKTRPLVRSLVFSFFFFLSLNSHRIIIHLALLGNVEPFVATANALLANSKDAKAKAAVQQKLDDLIKVTGTVSAPKPRNVVFSQAIPDILEIVTNMETIDPMSAAGQKEAQRMLTTLDALVRANKIEGMGPATSLMNHIVDVSKDLDGIESLLNHPGVKSLSSASPLDLVETDSQHILAYFKKLTPDETGGRDSALSDAERLQSAISELGPLARRAEKMDPGTARDGVAAQAKKALQSARAALDDVTAGMNLTAQQEAQVKAAEKTNTLCIKLGAMVGSKKQQHKQDIFSAAKGLTDLLGEMNALLSMSQAASGSSGSGPSEALLSLSSISGAGQLESQPRPVPRPGAAKKFASKAVAQPPATQYKTPTHQQQKQLATPDRGSVGQGFLAIGAGAEELKTFSVPSATKGSELLPTSDPLIQGVRGLGEQLAILADAATRGNNDALLKAGRAIHELIKGFTALLRKKAEGCKDAKAAHDLQTLASQLQNWSVQLKILASVKASSGGGRDSDKALISMTQQIQKGLRGAPTLVLAGLLLK